MPSFAGIPLCQPTPELVSWAEKTIPLRDIVQFNPVPYLDHLQSIMPYADQSDDPVELGTLWWPSGASRWAVGNFLVTESQRNEINAKINHDSVYSAADLVLDDGDASVTASMWMLPPRPLAQNPLDTDGLFKWLLPQTRFNDDSPDKVTGEPIYILPLVDDRYFWWQRVGNVKITGSTWAEVIDQIATGLRITIVNDGINDVYLDPPDSLIQYQNFLPLLLDLCAFATGLRVVRSLDGEVRLQSASNALAAATEQLVLNDQRMAGGVFSFDRNVVPS